MKISGTGNVNTSDMTATKMVTALTNILINYKLDQNYNVDKFRLLYQAHLDKCVHLKN